MFRTMLTIAILITLTITSLGEIVELELIASLNTPGESHGVAVSKNRAYVADKFAGMHVYDISNPYEPFQIGHINIPGNSNDVFVQGNYAYISEADGSALYIVNVINPDTLFIEDVYSVSDRLYSLQVCENLAYMCCGTFGLEIVDVSIPSDIEFVGISDSPGTASGVLVHEGYAYVTDYDYALHIYDVTNPAEPVLTGTFDFDGFARKRVAIRDNYVMVPNWHSGTQVVDVTDPVNPVRVTSFGADGLPIDIQLKDNYVYVADWSLGLRAVNITNPTAPIIEDTYYTSGHARGLDIKGEFIYAVNHNSFLVFKINFVDPGDNESLEYVGGIDTPGEAHGVDVLGDYAYVADSYSGMSVYDVSNPENPVQVGNVEIPGNSNDVRVRGEYAYVAEANDSYLWIIDISDPINPIAIESYEAFDRYYSLAVDDTYAYMTDGLAGLQIIDISTPTAPAFVGGHDTPGTASGVWISGNYAFVADHSHTLQIFDLTDPFAPSFTGGCDVAGAAPKGVIVRDNYAYVANWNSGLQIIDISNLSDPMPVSSCNSAAAIDVRLLGNYAYVADWDEGLHAINISNPLSPEITATYNTAGCARGIAIQGEYIYVVNHSSLKIFRHIIPMDFALKIEDVYGEPGSSVDVPIHAGGFGEQEIAGVELHLSFGEGCLEYSSFSSGYLTDALVNVENNQIHILWENFLYPFTIADGAALFTLNFNIIGELGEVCELSWLDNNEVVDPFGDILSSLDFASGSVSIVVFSDISGNITYFDMETGVPGVTVELAGDFSDTEITDEDGDYLFESSLPGDYSMCPSRLDDDPAVTVNDIIKIRRHIVQLELFDTPYKFIAADANENGFVSVSDIIKLRRYIAELDEIPAGNWTFVDASFEINENNWADAPQCIDFELEFEEITNLDFIGVRIGDVDKSWGSNGLVLDAQSDSVTIEIIDGEGYAGEIVNVPIAVRGFIDIAGVELHLAYSGIALELTNVNHEILIDPTINISDGEFHLVWDDIYNPITIENGEEVISLEFEILEAAADTVPVLFTASHVTDEFGTDFYIESIDGFIFRDRVSVDGDENLLPLTYSLSQNYPNPFNATTNIKYGLPISSIVTIEIYNLLGHKIKTLINNHQAAGYYRITWHADVSSGLYFYKIHAGDFTNIKKMVLLK